MKYRIFLFVVFLFANILLSDHTAYPQLNTSVGVSSGVQLPEEVCDALTKAGIAMKVLGLPERQGSPLMINENMGVYEGNVYYEDGRPAVGLGAKCILVQKGKKGDIGNYLLLTFGKLGKEGQSVKLAYYDSKVAVEGFPFYRKQYTYGNKTIRYIILFLNDSKVGNFVNIKEAEDGTVKDIKIPHEVKENDIVFWLQVGEGPKAKVVKELPIHETRLLSESIHSLLSHLM